MSFRTATVEETLLYGSKYGREGFERNGLLPAIAGAGTAATATPQVTYDLEEREVNSEYGQLWVNGYYQQDLVEFSTTLALGRTEIPVAGQDRIVYRSTRKGRTGSMTYRKADSRWEEFILGFMSITPDQRRALRAQGLSAFPEITLLCVLDDPDSWGAEVIQFNRVRLWELPMGFGGADIIERNLPLTWVTEQLLLGIPRPGDQNPLASPSAHATALGGALTSGISYGGFGGPTGL